MNLAPINAAMMVERILRPPERALWCLPGPDTFQQACFDGLAGAPLAAILFV
jgi:hypothetical protein